MKDERFVRAYDAHALDQEAKTRMLEAAYRKAEENASPQTKKSVFSFASKNFMMMASSAAAICVLFAGLWFFLYRENVITVIPPEPTETDLIASSLSDGTDGIEKIAAESTPSPIIDVSHIGTDGETVTTPPTIPNDDVPSVPAQPPILVPPPAQTDRYGNDESLSDSRTGVVPVFPNTNTNSPNSLNTAPAVIGIPSGTAQTVKTTASSSSGTPPWRNSGTTVPTNTTMPPKTVTATNPPLPPVTTTNSGKASDLSEQHTTVSTTEDKIVYINNALIFPPFVPPATNNTNNNNLPGDRFGTNDEASKSSTTFVLTTQTTTAATPSRTPTVTATTTAATSVGGSAGIAPSATTSRPATTTAALTATLQQPTSTTAALTVTLQQPMSTTAELSATSRPESTTAAATTTRVMTTAAPATTTTRVTTTTTTHSQDAKGGFPTPGALIPLTAENEKAIKNNYINYMAARSGNASVQFNMWQRITGDDLVMWYYGTYNGNSVVVFGVPGKNYTAGSEAIELAPDYVIEFSNSGYEMLVCTSNGVFMDVRDAYSQGLLSLRDISDIVYRVNPWAFGY